MLTQKELESLMNAFDTTFGNLKMSDMLDELKFSCSKEECTEDDKTSINCVYNLYENEDFAYIEVKVPGFEKDEITSELKDGLLSIVCKKQDIDSKEGYLDTTTSFDINETLKFKIKLRKDISNGVFDAKLKNGILTYIVQKVKEKDNSHYITIK